MRDLSVADLDRLALFPLPNTVFFPHVLLPLHIFEPRYRELVTDALTEDRPIAIPLMKPGGEHEQPPPIFHEAGAGWIVEHDKLPDGRYLITVEGCGRVHIVDEGLRDRAYREARALLLESREPSEPGELEAAMSELRDVAMGLAARRVRVGLLLSGLVEHIPDPDTLCDVVASTFVTDLVVRQEILGETRVDRRVRLAARGLADLMMLTSDHGSGEA
jgi:Lon protease-like protein